MNRQTLLGILIAAYLLQTNARASEGFTPSEEANVFLLKPTSSGATAFLLNVPNKGTFLITQVHVLEAVGTDAKVTWGKKYGSFFRQVAEADGAFELPLQQEILIRDETHDFAVLKAPQELIQNCHCTGLSPASYHDGTASLIGYPITGRRTYPRVGRFWTRVGELFGSVEQLVSRGSVWNDGTKILSDIDAISGDSGGPILDDQGRVIGIIYTMKTWYGDGYQYHSPSIEITPIDLVLGAIDRL